MGMNLRMDNAFIPISALQHYLYCPRQCALIHLEQQWSENRQTAEGRLLHDRADTPATERRHGVRTVTAMPLSNAELSITGVADVVEFHANADGEYPYPEEYKRGKPKSHRADEVQLCAQAFCLEAMFDTRIKEGALFYGLPRRRHIVAFDATLRSLTLEVIHATHELFAKGLTPSAKFDSRRCDACSLLDLCGPHLLARVGRIEDWLMQQLRD
jgi:CRISPR-associated exonuclease Cas4